MSETLPEALQRALGLLARREHSEKELRQKLKSRSINAEHIDLVVQQLKTEGLQSDMRYTESFVHHRSSRGFGPRRIAQELRQKGVNDEVVQEFIDEGDPHWLQRLEEVRARKFGDKAPEDYKEQARQSRFLQYRGFSTEQIHRLFKRLNEYED